MRTPGAADHAAVPEAATVTETGTRGAIHMRKTLATLAVIATGAVAFGSAASPASADDPNATTSYGYNPGVFYGYSCATTFKSGVQGQYGAWGNFIDGCTAGRLVCPADVQRCDVNGDSFIENYNHRNERVTMNSRIRRYDAGVHLYGWSDKSCDSQYDRCDVHDSSVIAAGQSASVQCNGVRAATANSAMDYCGVKLTYRALDRTSQQGRGECTDWALYRRPDLAGVVSGNAQNWRDQARNAGRVVSKTPTQGALMVLQGGTLGAFASTGHVAYVESVNATSFVVSEQNWNNIRTPTKQTYQISSLPASGVDFIG
jgi:surface antigen